MNTIIKSLAAFMMCAFLFTSCSSDDEPKNPSLDEVVTHIESVVNSHLGELYGNETLDHLLLPVDNDAEAKEVVKAFIGKDWNGQDFTYQVPGDNGRIRIKKDAEEGSYYTLAFSINGHRPFTFQICTPGYPESENAPQGLQHVSDSWQLGSASQTEPTTDTTEWADGSSEDVTSKKLLARYDGTETEAKMGDYYYSDGTWSDGGLRMLYADGTMKYTETTPLPGKTVIGLVFYGGGHPDDESDYSRPLTKNGPTIPSGIVHGYVVALTDVHDGKNDRLSWASGPGNDSFQEVGTSTDDGDWQGYSNSLKFHEFVNNTEGWEMKHFPAAHACETYGNRTTDRDGNDAGGKYDWQKPLAAPDNTSGWFLPSCGQLLYIWQNGDILSNNINKVKENTDDSALIEHIKWFSDYSYWSSTERSNERRFFALYVSCDGPGYNSLKSNTDYVRAVLAF